MSNVVNLDQDQQWLINCLSATLNTSQQVRSFAEASLSQASLQHGWLFLLFLFLYILCQMTSFCYKSFVLLNKCATFVHAINGIVYVVIIFVYFVAVLT